MNRRAPRGAHCAAAATGNGQYISACMLILPAYAKLNLALDVVARRDDGLHDIDSLLVPIDWHDLVGVALERAGALSVRLHLSGDTDGVPRGEDNLAARAAHAILENARGWGMTLWVHKRVPAAAGLGGGSADAAATLRAAARLLSRAGVALPRDVLFTIASSVGSDVPALLAGGAQRVRGAGDRLTPARVAELYATVVIAGAGSTAAAFGSLQAADLAPDTGRVERLIAAAAATPPPDDLMGSGLEAAATAASAHLGQSIARVRAATPEIRWHLTGSGGALFAVTASPAGATALAARMEAVGFAARACRTLCTA